MSTDESHVQSRHNLSRRHLLAGAIPLVGAGLASVRSAAAETGAAHAAMPSGDSAHDAGGGHAALRGREVDHAKNRFDPHALLRDFDYGTTRRLASGRVVREWELVATEQDIEIAPGVTFAAWSYNGRVPGPTLRAREGELLRIRFVNASQHPHTIHFHGIHPSAMDGVPGQGAGQIAPGDATTRREQLRSSFAAVDAHERALRQRLEEGLAALPGVVLHSRAGHRTPTLLVSLPGRATRDAYEFLATRGVLAPAGQFYAYEPYKRLGLDDETGLRLGLAPYSTTDDVDRVLAGLAEFLG